jgi:imidazolonepropionase-like amidohydrolase
MTGLGMSPAAALRSATSSAATLLGIDDRVGTIVVGKLADIIAVPGNPLDDIRQTEKVFFVMKEGQVVKNAR